MEASSLLDGGNEAGKYLFLLGPLVLQQDQELTEGPLVLGVTEGHVFEGPGDDLHAEWHYLIRDTAEETQLSTCVG